MSEPDRPRFWPAPIGLRNERKLLGGGFLDDFWMLGLAVGVESCQKLLGRHGLDGIQIERQQFLAVKARVGLSNAIQGEVLTQERTIEFFKVVPSGPAQQRQVIDQNFGEVSRTTEVIHTDFGQINAKFFANRSAHSWGNCRVLSESHASQLSESTDSALVNRGL